MKIILTEEQLKLVKMIKENADYVSRVKSAITKLKDEVNKLYSVVTFTTIAEIRDNDSDVDVMKQKVDVLSDKKDNLDNKVNDFEQANMSQDGDWNNPQAEKDYNDMDMALYHLSPKIYALDNIIDGMIAVSELENHEPFKDVKPTSI